MTSERRRRRTAPLAMAATVLVVAGLMAGGCSVSVDSQSGSEDAAADDVLDDGTLEIDLADPPTRADLAVPDGRERFVLEREGREPVAVTLRFRDGRVLETPASTIGVTTDGTGDPTSLVLGRDDLTSDELRAALEGAVTDVGADRGRVASFLAEAGDASTRRADLKRSIPADVDGAELSIQPVVTALEGRISINYTVSWDADGAGSAD